MDTLTRNLLFASGGGGFSDPEFVAATSNANTSGKIQLNIPSGTLNTDLIVAYVTGADIGISYGSASGFTKVADTTDSGVRTSFYYKLPGSTVPPTAEIVSGISGSAGNNFCVVVTVRRPGSPSPSYGSYSFTYFSPSSPNTSSGVGAIELFYGGGSGNTTLTPSTGSKVYQSFISNSGVTVAVSLRKGTSSATGTCTWTNGDSFMATATFL